MTLDIHNMAMSTQPPAANNSLCASNSLNTICTGLGTALGSKQIGCRLIQRGYEHVRPALQEAVQQQQRDSYGQPQLRGNQCLRDTPRHQPWIASAKQGDDLKGFDHAGNRSEQPQQRADSRNDRQRR